jgi:hypothetical protein
MELSIKIKQNFYEMIFLKIMVIAILCTGYECQWIQV